MSSLFVNYVRTIESYVRPWTPLGLSNAIWDVVCYDIRKLSVPEVFAGFYSRTSMIEGALIIVEPQKGNPAIKVCDLRKYPMEEALNGIDTIVVSGCGTSALGAIALGRTVAEALGRKVASIVAGYGRQDELGEIASGMVLSQLNGLLHDFDSLVRWAFGRSIPSLLQNRIFEVLYGIPEAATLHQILLRSPNNGIKLIVSHSKGNYAVAAALYALRCSLSTKEGQAVIASKTDFDVVTFGCWTRLPTNLGDARYHQYVGTADMLGFLNSPKWHLLEMWLQDKIWRGGPEYDEALVPLAMHNMLPWNPFHMPAEVILQHYKKGPPQQQTLPKAA